MTLTTAASQLIVCLSSRRRMKRSQPQTLWRKEGDLRTALCVVFGISVIIIHSILLYHKNNEREVLQEDLRNSCPTCTTHASTVTTNSSMVQPELRIRLRRTLSDSNNVALQIMVEYAHRQNLTKCWICQHLPTSSASPMLSPIPFSKADWQLYNWNNMSQTINSEECYTPWSRTRTGGLPILGAQDSREVLGIVFYVISKYNDQRPATVNVTKLLRLTYYKSYVLRGLLMHKLQMTLVQTNCDKVTTHFQCIPVEFTPVIRVEALVKSIFWGTHISIVSLTAHVHNCTRPLLSKLTKNRDCTQKWPVVHVYSLVNVSNCITNYNQNTGPELGQSSCEGQAMNTNFASAKSLPEQVYLVCDDRAYSCVPLNATGTCYLAYLIPLVRATTPEEVASSQIQRSRRALTITQRVFSVLIPAYGTYTSQEEISALSTVLERHMNLSTTAIVALQNQADETRSMVLQNRMALDLLLASQGGVCKVTGTECCAYISDSTQAVADLTHDTELGIRELHTVHGFDPFSSFETLFGSWGGSLIKFLIYLFVGLIVLCIIIALITACVKVCVNKLTTPVLVQINTDQEEWIEDGSSSEDEPV